MKLALDGNRSAAPIRERLEHPTFGEVTLLFRRPTGRDVIAAIAAGAGCATPAEARAAEIAAKLGAVIGWEGVEDEQGQPVPFSALAFSRACDQYPALAELAAWRAQLLFAGLAGEERKNSEAPPAPGSAAEATGTTGESSSGGDSASSGG